MQIFSVVYSVSLTNLSNGWTPNWYGRLFFFENGKFPASLHLIFYPFIEITVQKLNIFRNKCFLLNFTLIFFSVYFQVSERLHWTSSVLYTFIWAKCPLTRSLSLSQLVFVQISIHIVRTNWLLRNEQRPPEDIGKTFRMVFLTFDTANQTTSI